MTKVFACSRVYDAYSELANLLLMHLMLRYGP